MAKKSTTTTRRSKPAADASGDAARPARSKPAPGGGKQLVIVESPTKAKTIGKYLGPDFVVLASVVEKETGAKEERPQIASVFTNRLRKRMRLESDPTTIYGMWERYTGNIRKDDLLQLTPYNTYKIPALPLGPIANPSFEAIQAVMAPATTEYLFFVSKNDGTHQFTTNYADHQRAVDEWQRNRSNRAGKSWRQLKQ
jgi:UPF0755 protein